MHPLLDPDLRQLLSREIPFLYYPDRESPWLLARSMPPSARVSELKRGPLARWLDRPLVHPVVAASGGTLRRADVHATAEAEQHGLLDLTGPGTAGVTAAFDRPWYDFALSFTTWGETLAYGENQTSRPGLNLVIQLGFPSDHAALMGRYLLPNARKAFECSSHPVRMDGRPTLAWARVDIEKGVALVEEVQTDWLRFAALVVAEAYALRPRHRETRALADYEAELRRRYGKIWSRAMLLATLIVLHELDVREVYMHQPGPGAALKNIKGASPPASLYSALPKSFGFAATGEVPPFIRRERRKDVARLRRVRGPLFWRLAL